MKTIVHIIKSTVVLTIGLPVLLVVMMLFVFWDLTETRAWGSVGEGALEPQLDQGKLSQHKPSGYFRAGFQRAKARVARQPVIQARSASE